MDFIIQWNMNGFFNNLEMLKLLLTNSSPKIICIQETNLKHQYLSLMKNYNAFIKNRQNQNISSGGVAILTKNNIETSEIQLNTNLEAIAVSVNCHTKINICNIYLAPNREINYDEITDLLGQIPSPRIILGDFNAYNTIWGSPTTNKRGSILEKLIEDNNLAILNTGSPTRFNHITENAHT